MSERSEILRKRIDEAIGGRDRAAAFAREIGQFNRMTLQRWIDGKTFPDSSEVEALAAATGHPFEWFFGLEKPVPVILPPPETVVVQVLNVQASSHRRPAAS